MEIELIYGPERFNAVEDLGALDHPFSRCMPDEVVEKIDRWIALGEDVKAVLVEEYPLTYLRYLVGQKVIQPFNLVIWWYYYDEEDECDNCLEIRVGKSGELLDPWPTGFFDRSLEFALTAPKA